VSNTSRMDEHDELNNRAGSYNTRVTHHRRRSFAVGQM
jgi:hypothetical protein